ncbi:MAG: rRNA maturation RNase YbeY [Candidatus Omnitrophica bacterium]|nr:rRNA maturation RNase YbeY [Candidatus Omnitrophota bacterium]
MKKFKVTVKNLQKKLPINPKKIKSLVFKVLSSEGARKSGEINICFVNDAKISEFNSKYLGINRPTDVLAFDISENKDHLLTDIIISTDTAFSNSKVFNTTPLFELYLYVIHGTLHVLGYDDSTSKQRKIMEKKSSRYVHT